MIFQKNKSERLSLILNLLRAWLLTQCCLNIILIRYIRTPFELPTEVLLNCYYAIIFVDVNPAKKLSICVYKHTQSSHFGGVSNGFRGWCC
jgi:hypothetical protein